MKAVLIDIILVLTLRTYVAATVFYTSIAL